MPTRLTAHDLIDLVLDAESWSSWDTPPVYGDISESYAAELAAAREKAGTDESVLTDATRVDIMCGGRLSKGTARPAPVSQAIPSRCQSLTAPRLQA